MFNHFNVFYFLFPHVHVCVVDDWRADQYRWVNQGVTQLPRRQPQLRKHYFAMDTPKGVSKEFQKHAYQLIGKKDLTLIHYLGDENAAVQFNHRGTEARQSHHFQRTCPSTLRRCAQMCKEEKANVVYKREVASMTCNPEQVAALVPRNVKQLRNLRFKHLHQNRITHDALYNIHELAYDTPGFIWRITTYPDLLCICGLEVSAHLYIYLFCAFLNYHALASKCRPID